MTCDVYTACIGRPNLIKSFYFLSSRIVGNYEDSVLSYFLFLVIRSRLIFYMTSYNACHNYAVADWSSLGHVIVKRHEEIKGHALPVRLLR